MNTLRIEILNPKARKLLKDLADLELISIEKTPVNSFTTILRRIRTKSKTNRPTLEEITKEVELVRSKRYGK